MTTKSLTKYKYWLTKDGQSIRIDLMTTSHLLNTIHLIEKSRLQQIASLEIQVAEKQLESVEHGLQLLEYYTKWPDTYSDLLKEAEKRKLIKRK